MAKVLSSISLDSPASPLGLNTGSSFTFAGTPTLTGGGGAQRYDFRWEVNSGTGFVPITGSTGLTTADTNPLINTNSQSQNAITVTCSVAGSYTIRMAGAPTSGGSYTVLSPTQSVTVTLGAITGSLTTTETGADAASASGSVAIAGALSASESGDDTASITGSLEGSGITGTLAATDSGTDTGQATGTVAVTGALNATSNGSDTYSGTGQTGQGTPPPQARKCSMSLSFSRRRGLGLI